jgi:hypothetical protein
MSCTIYIPDDFFTPEQLAEIDRRVAAADAGEIIGIPSEIVFAELLSRK